ncbi:STN and carboxypeptidase regulatory-like domain-containing protein [Dyadobacter crusticola]|uniref:STN and carboxypeptidase regulatory-like domain-containing protein n=1 Tax=Dyadobacter crusticola TaxID=292407 RepID=UPI000692494B|nr:STN and carboxypeptidase regulatory-like domain-containing protein [Dyadobacter crusticola]
MNLTFSFIRTLQLAIILIVIPLTSFAQQLLNKPVAISVKGQPVSEVLKTIGVQGNFYFSYNSNIISGDSLVSLNVSQKPVRDVLFQLFGDKYQYKEKGDYLIILPAARDKSVVLTGYIIDQETNAPVDYASVYSRQLLISTMSEDDGRFRLKVRERSFPVNVVVSKVGYADTTIVFDYPGKTEIRVLVNQKAVDLDPLIVRYSEGESTWLGRLFLSARTRMQSRNISRFFVALPYQASLTPGLGTHGRMSPQVVNKFSLNILGGYTAGVNGAEIAGGFNISRQNVRYLQIAGVFNVVSGKVDGAQVAGFHNQIIDSLSGVQVSGFSGIVKKRMEGAQISGFLSRARAGMGGAQISGAFNLVEGASRGTQIAGAYNQASDNFNGGQVAGAANYVKDTMSGMQIAGGLNVAGAEARGMQLAPINYTKNLKGFQLGIINIADSSSGASLGLINIIRKSTSNISVFAMETAPFNLAWKMGTHRFYSILTAGMNTGAEKRTYQFGAGLGKEFFPFRKFGFFTELVSLNMFQGDWENTPSLSRFQAAVTWKPSKRIVIFAGPAYSLLYDHQKEGNLGYKSYPPKNYPSSQLSDKVTSWLGWQGGISWRYGRL